MAPGPERTARLPHFSHYACLIARLLEWLIDHLEVHQCSAALKLPPVSRRRVPPTTIREKSLFVKRQHFIRHICSTWFIDPNAMQIQLPNDLVGCLFWFAVHRLPCGVKGGEGVFFHRLRKWTEKCFAVNPISGTKWWMLLLSSSQFVEQCMGDTTTVCARVLLMLLSRPHRSKKNSSLTEHYDSPL